MNDKQTFINQGFSVLSTENKETELLAIIKQKFPQIIQDGELNMQELKAILGMPIVGRF